MVVARRDDTTEKVRVSSSRRAEAPVPVVAVIVTEWLPTVSFGSAIVFVSNASACNPVMWSPRLSESTAKETRAPAGSAVP